MTVKACCDEYCLECEPKRPQPQKDKFFEVHTCPTCKSKIKITFEVNTVNGELDYAVLLVEPA